MRRLYATTHEKPTISVTVGEQREDISLFVDNSTPDTWKRFFCSACGKVAFEYKDNLQIIAAGNSDESVKAPVRVQCKSCKTVYVIQN